MSGHETGIEMDSARAGMDASVSDSNGSAVSSELRSGRGADVVSNGHGLTGAL